MNRYQIGIYEKAIPEEYTIRQMLEFCKDAKYDFFEISIDRTDKRIGRLYDQDFIKTLKKDAEEVGLPIGSMCLSGLGTYTLGNPDPKTVEKAIEIFLHAIDFAERVGIRIIQIPACDVPKNEEHTKDTDRRFIENLKIMIDYASAHSMIIGLENMEDEYMDTVEKSMRLLEAVNSPLFLLYSDAGNITSASKLYGTSIENDMLMGKNKYCAIHLKETRPNKYGGLFYGDGHVDFQNIIKTTWKDLGIRRYVLEYWYTGNPYWKQDLKNARQMCVNWIRNAETKGTIQ